MNILAGGCLAVGCRYAGTGNQQASSCLVCSRLMYVHAVFNLRLTAPDYQTNSVTKFSYLIRAGKSSVVLCIELFCCVG